MTELTNLKKGYAWEYRVSRAMFLSGWYVRRSVDLRERVGGSPQTMAEVDLLGFHFDSALRQRMLVGECKDRKGSAKEADRVVWLLGLARMLGASEILFAKTRLADGTLQFARPFGMYLWDEAAVSAVERRFGLEPNEGFVGSSNVSLREDLLVPARASGTLRGTPLRSAWEYLAGPFWYSANPKRLKQLALYFDALADSHVADPVARSSFVAEGLVALLACASVTAGELTRNSPARAASWQQDAFSAGAADARTLRDIGARADDYYRDLLRKLMADQGARGTAPIEAPRLADVITQPPDWLESFLKLAERLSEEPQTATDLLRYADIVLFEHHLVGTEIGQDLDRLFGGPRQDLRRVLDLAALFLQRVWGVQDRLLDDVLRRNARSPHGPTLGRGRPDPSSSDDDAEPAMSPQGRLLTDDNIGGDG